MKNVSREDEVIFVVLVEPLLLGVPADVQNLIVEVLNTLETFFGGNEEAGGDICEGVVGEQRISIGIEEILQEPGGRRASSCADLEDAEIGFGMG
ncbi:hypothetical protein I7I53_03090 [Histoplasma capsulatum var. duboisii H88]|uniref:Uncharacterized protein n=1 Tax=Ajellomyces capsulatus (strain H88) TaxID=544711 RepID=A0A8A1LLQ1_AJEC8|nr:hypothetical protein I7I53_03090 [Histoplasma capsulatum var. duboisii H88]